MSIQERLLSKININNITECWNWTAAVSQGYGRIYYNGKIEQAHRVSYELFKDKIPDGFVIDHLCENKRCINPDHLEPVTDKINIQRSSSGNSKKTHCPSGHEYSATNTYIDPRGWRNCILCEKIRKGRI